MKTTIIRTIIGALIVALVGTAATPAQAAQAARPGWPTVGVTVLNPLVRPIPVVDRVRTAPHPAAGYDRVVFDIAGSTPSYRVRYVPAVRTDPADTPVFLPGGARRYLLVTFFIARAHRGPATTISGTHVVGLPQLRSYAVVGDFEGYVTVALGLRNGNGFHVGVLPGRVYVDVSRF